MAHLLKGLPDRPPLQAASEVIESASVNIGLLVEGRPFLGSTVDVVSASGGLEGSVVTHLDVETCNIPPTIPPVTPPPEIMLVQIFVSPLRCWHADQIQTCFS